MTIKQPLKFSHYNPEICSSESFDLMLWIDKYKDDEQEVKYKFTLTGDEKIMQHYLLDRGQLDIDSLSEEDYIKLIQNMAKLAKQKFEEVK
jgi:hypothetical protein